MREKLVGRKRTLEARKRMSDSHKGQVAHNKGKHCKIENGKRIYY